MKHMAPPNLVFMGVCGCGKSTVAELYARHTDAALIEADFFHPPENIAKMSAGTPLTDADRAGWLAALATRIADGKARGEALVVTCSALKKAYRDRLRAGDPELLFVFLDGGQELLQARLDGRKGHFMPSSLLGSQLATLERPDPDTENCLQVSISLTPDEICATVAGAARPQGLTMTQGLTASPPPQASPPAHLIEPARATDVVSPPFQLIDLPDALLCSILTSTTSLSAAAAATAACRAIRSLGLSGMLWRALIFERWPSFVGATPSEWGLADERSLFEALERYIGPLAVQDSGRWVLVSDFPWCGLMHLRLCSERSAAGRRPRGLEAVGIRLALRGAGRTATLTLAAEPGPSILISFECRQATAAADDDDPAATAATAADDPAAATAADGTSAWAHLSAPPPPLPSPPPRLCVVPRASVIGRSCSLEFHTDPTDEMSVDHRAKSAQPPYCPYEEMVPLGFLASMHEGRSDAVLRFAWLPAPPPPADAAPADTTAAPTTAPLPLAQLDPADHVALIGGQPRWAPQHRHTLWIEWLVDRLEAASRGDMGRLASRRVRALRALRAQSLRSPAASGAAGATAGSRLMERLRVLFGRAYAGVATDFLSRNDLAAAGGSNSASALDETDVTAAEGPVECAIILSRLPSCSQPCPLHPPLHFGEGVNASMLPAPGHPCLACMCSPRRPLFPTGVDASMLPAPGLYASDYGQQYAPRNIEVVAVRVMRLGPSELDTARRMWRERLGERLGEERLGEAARRRLHLSREAPRLGAATLVATKVVGDVHVPAGATTFYVPLEGHSEQRRFGALDEPPCLACMCSPRRPLFPTGEQRRFVEEPILPEWPSAAAGAVPSTSASTLPLEAKPLWKGYGCLATPGFRSSQFSEGRLQVLDEHRFVFSWLGENEHVYHRLPDQWDS